MKALAPVLALALSAPATAQLFGPQEALSTAVGAESVQTIDLDATSYQQGSTLGFDLICRNWSSSQATYYHVVDVKLTSGKYYKLNPATKVTIGPDATKTIRYDFPLPATPPLGHYRLRVRGGLPGSLWNSDIVLFEVIP